ncbi:hypothetical protein BC567DRAFT_222984 [Phyllosticta citribraziliensis]
MGWTRDRAWCKVTPTTRLRIMVYNPAANGWARGFAPSRRPLETFLLAVVSSAQSLYLMASAASPFASSDHALRLPLESLIFPRTHVVFTSFSSLLFFFSFSVTSFAFLGLHPLDCRPVSSTPGTISTLSAAVFTNDSPSSAEVFSSRGI